MVGAGLVAIAGTGLGLWLLWRRRLEHSRRFLWAALSVGMALPLIGNTAGWVFTEMGRQPWAVFGLLRTEDAVSPTVSAAWVATSLAGFTLIYGALAAVDAWLMVRYAKAGPAPAPPAGSEQPSELAPVLAY
jgi:cytochrome bd ubiquinol oxidase subunit I